MSLSKEQLEAKVAALEAKIQKLEAKLPKRTYKYTCVFRYSLDESKYPEGALERLEYWGKERGDTVDVKIITATSLKGALRKCIHLQDEYKDYVEVLVGVGGNKYLYGHLWGKYYYREAAEGTKKRFWYTERDYGHVRFPLRK